MSKIIIDQRPIGNDYPPYIIAELSANHNGSLDRALETITAAKSAGADAIKIQTYTADTMTIDCDLPEFMVDGDLWGGQTLHSLYQQAYTPYEWHQAIFEHAREIGITCFSTPFDESAIELLESLNSPAYKVASFELVDLPLLEQIAQTGKPVIMSTGMATLTEIDEAVNCLKASGCTELAILHCISSYPAPASEANLLTLPDLAQRFKSVAGLSDHTLGTTVSVAAVALGASIIEKHFILSRSEIGPDSSFSIEPDELSRLCSEAKTAWSARGEAGYTLKDSETFGSKYRRSLYFVKDIKAGDLITAENLRRIRPGFGLPPKHYKALLGKRVSRDITRGTSVTWEHIQDE